MQSPAIELCERGLVPDALARAGMRRLIGTRLRAPQALDGERRDADFHSLLARAASGAIAEQTDTANDQHYALPPAFFRQTLGPRLKYSSGLFAPGVTDLTAAEDAMLSLTAERAGLADGQRILDLGCGWGSLSLWAAERYPNAQILAVSNSSAQKDHIDACAAVQRLGNLRVQTCDINQFEPGACFNRVVSIEMFEHMRNWQELLRRVAGWLTDDGQLFMHIFCHKLLAYQFVDAGRQDWMARHFFSGGIMPSENFPLCFCRDLIVRDHWWLSGRHYQATANAWLANLDAHRDAVRTILGDNYGPAAAGRWQQRWRMFFMTVAELFGYRGGNEWGVGHYLFVPRRA